jgi:hypothetical protein
MSSTAPWTVLALLGAFHGLNPAMGWLFAVALGLQNGRRRAVLEALPPIALGHLVSVAIVVVVVMAARRVVPLGWLGVVGGVALIALGVFKLVRPFRHPRWVGMRVGFRDLTVWSFLMSAAHGAGLMLVPVLLRLPGTAHVHGGDGAGRVALAEVGAGSSNVTSSAIVALGVHTAAMFLVMAVLAVAVYEVLGLELLRRGWINFDFIWAVALIVAGVVTLVGIASSV